ncbi:MAG: hypothetical protein N4J56_006991 [Chroococcidiopsis sp. SAG 2025]|uniref:sigma-70 family RNA polymerase sigma factor n=1 Tax=Chroococcidiopsis sp. SAG 2025 TaxID=171389 RepID=UPI000D07173A|nr:sigma-70 family RNA polymerase sigma factor [Chroococcidiopsis sp. SAG 2025]MDV2997286.1 hypothetical protein [Chroococcidiopsis sp. SAG 2025]PSB49151.1 hypothetical protein C7B80_02835 [Cyanosarcina cf. burmensis CCALA 770]
MALDEQLKQLATIAQQHPEESKRKEALTLLVQDIWKSGRLYRPSRGEYSPEQYREIYQEALQNLFLFVCQEIDRYNPELGEVITWCNVLLERRFCRNASRQFRGNPGIRSVTLSDLEDLALSEAPLYPGEDFRSYIESDPHNLFEITHIKNHPEANFAAITILRLVEDESWQEISDRFGITVSTLSVFYQRCLRRFESIIRQDLSI